jgi:hypothetical protein
MPAHETSPRAVALATVAALVAVAACQPDPPPDACSGEPVSWGPGDMQGSLLRCEVVPELCGLPVESTINEPDLRRAIDLVFVGDGYTAATLPRYRERVDELVAGLVADGDGIVGRDPRLFNFHRVDVRSPGTAPGSRALRSCVAGPPDALWLSMDDARALRAAANAPDVDLVLGLVLGTPGRGHAGGDPSFGPGVVVLNHGDSHRVFTHEMGHALVGLADEYVEFDDTHYMATSYERWTMDPLPPNLSLSADESWGGLVSGTVEGGGRFARGVYRPTRSCRMSDSRSEEVSFCPVCAAAIQGMLAGRRGIADGRPRCGLALGHPDERGHRRLLTFGRDENGLRSLALEVDGEVWIPQGFVASRAADAAYAPVFLEVGASVAGSAREATVTCVDSQGEHVRTTMSLTR